LRIHPSLIGSWLAAEGGSTVRKFVRAIAAAAIALAPTIALAQVDRPPTKWVTSWAGSVHGPFPVGNPSAQPDQRFAFPFPAGGSRDQTFRMMVRPDVWGRKARMRFTNALGTKPLALDGIYVGLQLGGPALVKGSNRPVAFGGKPEVTIAPGASVWSDPVDLGFVRDPDAADLAGRRLAVSFHVIGESGPMTWHAKALTTSFVTAPGAGAEGASEDEAGFPYSTASWFFLDAVDMMVPADTRLVVAFGDSITDGTASSMNGDDRWPDVLSRRLHRAFGTRIAVVNAGIGGNQVAGPADYSPQKPFPGGPAAGARLERDVLSLSGVSALVWLEGINDFSRNGNASLDTVAAGMRDVVGRLRARIPGVRVIGATVTTALNATNAAHGFREQDDKRRALNGFIKKSGLFDAVVDFDAVTFDPSTGEMKPEFVPESTTGGPGDKLHPNRAGYLAMGEAFDLGIFGVGQ
jgi:lysophospholipase L1-like esterase